MESAPPAVSEELRSARRWWRLSAVVGADHASASAAVKLKALEIAVASGGRCLDEQGVSAAFPARTVVRSKRSQLPWWSQHQRRHERQLQ